MTHKCHIFAVHDKKNAGQVMKHNLGQLAHTDMQTEPSTTLARFISISLIQ